MACLFLSSTNYADPGVTDQEIEMAEPLSNELRIISNLIGELLKEMDLDNISI